MHSWISGNNTRIPQSKYIKINYVLWLPQFYNPWLIIYILPTNMNFYAWHNKIHQSGKTIKAISTWIGFWFSIASSILNTLFWFHT
jgi:hypothetical protein